MTGEEILDAGVQHRRAPARQAQHLDPSAVRRREGADRAVAGVLAVPAQPGAVLPAGRGGRAAGRHQHRALLPAGAEDVAADPVPVHQPQQDHHGTRRAAGRHHHAGAGRVARWSRWTSTKRCASARRPRPRREAADRGPLAPAACIVTLIAGSAASRTQGRTPHGENHERVADRPADRWCRGDRRRDRLQPHSGGAVSAARRAGVRARPGRRAARVGATRPAPVSSRCCSPNRTAETMAAPGRQEPRAGSGCAA